MGYFKELEISEMNYPTTRTQLRLLISDEFPAEDTFDESNGITVDENFSYQMKFEPDVYSLTLNLLG